MAMTPEAYRAEILRARRAADALRVPTLRRLLGHIRAYAARLEREILARSRRGLLPSSARQQTLAAALQAADDLEERLVRATREGIRMSASEVADITDRATRRFVTEAARERLSEARAESLVGFFVDGGNLEGATAYLQRIQAGEAPVASRFETLLRGRVRNAAEEVDAIITRGIVERVPPDRLARRLRGYVEGSEEFGTHLVVERDAEGNVTGRKIDLRTVPNSRAANRMAYNAERIAFTEMHTAQHEATVSAMREAPQVEGVKWNTSVDRGTASVPDECDYLEQADFYGLGPGIYPPDKVPPVPHPFDRCFTTPVMRDFKKWREPKPEGQLTTDVEDAVSGGTETRRQRAVDNARSVVTGRPAA